MKIHHGILGYGRKKSEAKNKKKPQAEKEKDYEVEEDEFDTSDKPITVAPYHQKNSIHGKTFYSPRLALKFVESELEKVCNGSDKKSLKFYGMSSQYAQEKYNDGLKKYRTSEGKCVSVPYKGAVEDVIQDILGGLRSACTYVGASKLKHFNKCCDFVRVSRTHNTIYGNGT